MNDGNFKRPIEGDPAADAPSETAEQRAAASMAAVSPEARKLFSRYSFILSSHRLLQSSDTSDRANGARQSSPSRCFSRTRMRVYTRRRAQYAT